MFNHGEIAIASARKQMGVAMGRVSLVQSYLDSGELIMLFPAVAAGYGYDLICPAGLEQRPRYRAFSEWLRQQISATPAL